MGRIAVAVSEELDVLLLRICRVDCALEGGVQNLDMLREEKEVTRLAWAVLLAYEACLRRKCDATSSTGHDQVAEMVSWRRCACMVDPRRKSP